MRTMANLAHVLSLPDDVAALITQYAAVHLGQLAGEFADAARNLVKYGAVASRNWPQWMYLVRALGCLRGPRAKSDRLRLRADAIALGDVRFVVQDGRYLGPVRSATVTDDEVLFVGGRAVGRLQDYRCFDQVLRVQTMHKPVTAAELSTHFDERQVVRFRLRKIAVAGFVNCRA